MSKSKGTRTERELLHKFYNTNEWICLRAPGSGNTTLPSPDLLAGNGKRHLAIECKATKKTSKHFPKQEIEDLENFARKFGAEPWVGLRFDQKEWFFLRTKDLKDSGKMFGVSLKLIEEKGLTFEKLIKL